MEIRNTYFHNPVGAISIKEKLVLLNVKKIVPNIHGTPSEMTHSHWLPREGHCVKKKIIRQLDPNFSQEIQEISMSLR